DYVLGVAEDVARELVDTFCPRDQHPDQWNTTQFLAEINAQFGVDAKAAGADPATLSRDELAEATVKAVTTRYEEKEKQFSADLMRWLERRIILDVVDSQWKDHLLSLDHLKEGIGLRGYGQKDPLVEFKKEAFVLFEDMMARIDNETIRYLFHIQVQQNEQPSQGGPGQAPPPPQPIRPRAGAAVASAAARASEPPPQRLPEFARQMERKQERQQKELQYQTGPAQAEAPKPVRAGAKVGRNDPCPCGSGKKYKKCHGANA
ncbi:MAG TPA: SEC-C metal-binding domain-containing protein, partial [Opitutaceae bacterium]|nr:SEC-C metal-binding domain-containing protein [Opitutaceae bacterium]